MVFASICEHAVFSLRTRALTKLALRATGTWLKTNIMRAVVKICEHEQTSTQ